MLPTFTSPCQAVREEEGGSWSNDPREPQREWRPTSSSGFGLYVKSYSGYTGAKKTTVLRCRLTVDKQKTAQLQCSQTRSSSFMHLNQCTYDAAANVAKWKKRHALERRDLFPEIIFETLKIQILFLSPMRFRVVCRVLFGSAMLRRFTAGAQCIVGNFRSFFRESVAKRWTIICRTPQREGDAVELR